MPSAAELRERLRTTKKRLRELEDAALAERRREQEVERAYAQANVVRPATLPPGYLDQRSK